MVAAPPATAMKIAVRCTGSFDGRLCNKLLFYLLADSPAKIEIKCPKCGYVQEYR